MENNLIKVFYDGLCVVCSAEIEHYKTMKGSEKIEFVDINGPTFNPAQEKLDPFKVHIELHAKDSEGRIHIGVDAFILIWSELDKLKWLSKIATRAYVKKILELNYSLFVKIRPYLPRRSCENSPYCNIEDLKKN